MATEKSKRDLEQRKRDYDQISFLIPKGGRRLLRALGIRERCTAADVIRRAVMSRAGLERIPNEKNLEKLDAAESRKEATDALIACQRDEYANARWRFPWSPSQAMTDDEIFILEKIIIPALRQQRPFDPPATIKVSKNLYVAMSRLLSRMEYDDNNL
jgi:hypothetical protein